MAGRNRMQLTLEAALSCKRLLAEKNAWGRPAHTQAEIARMLGCSETTVFRVQHGLGAYQNIPDYVPERPSTAVEIAASAASMARVKAMLEAAAAPAPEPEGPELSPETAAAAAEIAARVKAGN